MLKYIIKIVAFMLTPCIYINVNAQKADAYQTDLSAPATIAGLHLVWNDEFNNNGQPDTANWTYEKGFVRNEELQWYQPQNAYCKNGSLVIEGRREQFANPNYKAGDNDWRHNRQYVEYTSASLKTQGLQQWKFGRFEIRARIDTSMGSWPAIWTLGTTAIPWPSCGEIDIMEFYRINNVPTILANVACGTSEAYKPKWFSNKIPFADFIAKDKDWDKKFHIWRMDWDENAIKIFIDDVLINNTALSQTLNADGTNPFLQPQYLLLNLAIGGNGGNPATAKFPLKYEVDYVRVYQKDE
jgi:beta-glucanase (GH16 family)